MIAAILIGILVAVGAVAVVFFGVGSIFAIVTDLLKKMPPWGWLVIACILMGLWISHGNQQEVSDGGGCGCGCRRRVRPPKPPEGDRYDVINVESAVAIKVKAGMLKRQTGTVILAGIEGPSDLALAQQAKEHMVDLVGTWIMVEGNLHFNSAEMDDVEGPCKACNGTGKTAAPAEWIQFHPEDGGKEFECWACNGDKTMITVAARKAVIRGTVYGGTSGVCLQRRLLELGFARTTSDVKIPEDWADAEKEAKKAQRGIWHK